MGKKNADGGWSSIRDWTSYLGSDKRKLMNNLPAQLEQNDIFIPETKGTVIKIWKDFNDLYREITNLKVNDETEAFLFEHGKQ